MYNSIMTSGTNNAILPMCLHPHKQIIPRTPYRISAIYKTTWLWIAHRRFPPNAAICLSCCHSFSKANPTNVQQTEEIISRMIRDPHLTRSRIMLPIDPPLFLQFQVFLEIVEQICTRHCTSSEEMSTHPAFLKIIWSSLMAENVNKQLSTRF